MLPFKPDDPLADEPVGSGIVTARMKSVGRITLSLTINVGHFIAIVVARVDKSYSGFLENDLMITKLYSWTGGITLKLVSLSNDVFYAYRPSRICCRRRQADQGCRFGVRGVRQVSGGYPGIRHAYWFLGAKFC